MQIQIRKGTQNPLLAHEMFRSQKTLFLNFLNFLLG
jgi:hypothetical protein